MKKEEKKEIDEIERYRNDVKIDCTESYHLRIKGHEDLSREILNDWIITLPIGVSRYIVAKETSKKGVEHYHVVIEVLKTVKLEQIRNQFKEKFTFLSGNKAYSLAKSRDRVKVIIYVSKEDTDLVSSGYRTELLERCKGLSFDNKKSKEQFNLLKDEYLQTQMDIFQYAEKYLLLKVEADQNIYLSHCEAHLRCMDMKKNTQSIKTCAHSLVDKIRN